MNKVIVEANTKDLIEEISAKEYKKINLNDMKNDKFERKSYLSDLEINSVRMKFGIKTKMVKSVKLNYKNDPINKQKVWKCDDCESIDSQEHILWCPDYSLFRKDRNLDGDRDLTRYFKQVLQFKVDE